MHHDEKRVEEVADNIFRIPVPLPGNPLKELNSYLIFDAERSVLIDTGFRLKECREALYSGLDELGVDPRSVDIFLTHLHADHSGLSTELVGEGRRILISDIECRILQSLPAAGEKRAYKPTDRREGNRARDILAGMPADIIDSLASVNPAIVFAPPGGNLYTSVKDGEILSAGGRCLRCVLAPGHSPGHMCLWDEENALMFTGDHVLFDITPNITAWLAVEDALGDYLESLEMIREYPVKTALPGHRKSGDFHARIDELFRHHDVRLAEVEGIVSENPGLSAYEVAGMMRWKIRARSWDEFPAAQKIFAVGECMAHLDYLRIRGSVKRELDVAVYRYYSS